MPRDEPDPTTDGPRTEPLLTVPCPLCRHVLVCPYVERPPDECLELWPLSTPTERRLPKRTAREQFLNAEAMHDPMLSRIVRAWRRGDRVSDEQYLALRNRIVASLPDADEVGMYVFMALVAGRMRWYLEHAKSYYGLDPLQRYQGTKAASWAILRALALCREDLVEAVGASSYQSAFERFFYEAMKLMLWHRLSVGHLQLPEDGERFGKAFETEWRRVLQCGNGAYGLTVVPLVSMADMVRYQQGAPARGVISWSVAEYVACTMHALPAAFELLAPRLKQVAFGDRLMAMFEPLVASCATEAARRARFDADERRSMPWDHLYGLFQAELADAIARYDFMHRRQGVPEDSAGMIGLASSPHLREHTQAGLERIDSELAASHLTHVNIAHTIGTQLRRHLREHHRPRRGGVGNSIEPHCFDPRVPSPLSRAMGMRCVWDPPMDRTDPADRWTVTEPAAAICEDALEHEGVRYLFARQMAARAGVSIGQLRALDDQLQVRRAGEVLPGIVGRVSRLWRLYPDTPEMVERIEQLVHRRGQRSGELAADEYRRPEAANELGISTKTLQRWEKAGRARPQWRNRRPIYTAEELGRLDELKKAEDR